MDSAPHPRLVAVHGPLAGRSFPLREEPLVLGRHGSSDIQIRDIAVSRQHCAVERADGRFLVRDLESRHGTFVNGLPVRERTLEAGDLVAVGASTFLFLEGGTESGAETGPPYLEDAGLVAESTVHLPVSEALHLRTAADLQVLLRVGAELQGLRSTGALARRLLERALEAAPAERAALVLLDPGTGEPASSFHLDARGSATSFPVSRTLAGQVLRERSAILAADALQAPDVQTESVRAARIRSLICAPLVGPEGPLGILYMDRREEGPLFEERHFQLVTALAGIAAVALDNVRRLEWLESENHRLETSLGSDMVGESPRMREVNRLIARVAPSDSTVLLRGESGTGKELAARAIHRASRRAGRPFVAINCATLSETLLESELFGHERGAFTGAVTRKVGKLEVADSGTLFLDEIGEMPPQLQAKLLRVLQEREFDRLGGTRPVKVDVRLIAATHRDLEKGIREGTFREDLYYRLNVISIEMPPLRERREDIPLLASHFAARLDRKLGQRVAGFTPEARAALLRYSWPGNVRELANAVERAVVLGDSEVIRAEDLPETVLDAGSAAGAPPVTAFHGAVQDFKRRLILDAVERAAGNITKAAEGLGLHPNYLHRLITSLDLRPHIKS